MQDSQNTGRSGSGSPRIPRALWPFVAGAGVQPVAPGPSPFEALPKWLREDRAEAMLREIFPIVMQPPKVAADLSALRVAVAELTEAFELHRDGDKTADAVFFASIKAAGLAIQLGLRGAPGYPYTVPVMVAAVP